MGLGSFLLSTEKLLFKAGQFHITHSLSLSGLGFKMAFLKILLQNDPILSHILSLKNLFENYRL